MKANYIPQKKAQELLIAWEAGQEIPKEKWICMETTGRYVGIDNESGDCWVEDFETEKECLEWLNGTESFETELEINQIANILYNMSLDMDYADNAENAADEIDILTDQLKMIRNCGFDTLLNALDLIAMQNIDQENRYF